ncbi:endonuclease domain-containing protein [Sphingomonas sp. MMS24-J13]|uniref:endonuclease domain-containing protein n=1 Tax=Sphingomonas sp. MMS24-J13 TaxID=3238686 RepID=UPI0038507D87
MQALPESPSPFMGEGLGRGPIRERARALRRNQTEAEQSLWKLLRAKRFERWKFRRQYPIGYYIVDFACPAARLIVEADGSQHVESAHDARRDAWLASQGWRVIRFWNHHILNEQESVLTAIFNALSDPLPNPSPIKGEGLEGGTFG